ncbi:3-dehydroquinate synthase [Kangiella sp. HZ709]|uniref:3-dehydroquinate synthase n=1 Tax=Kangiella sp. HZ709 TaxID=2666328 RepID=UPI0012AF23A0|nr:3-dehydroquinate synthase [Kangiella sp. HZ709]
MKQIKLSLERKKSNYDICIGSGLIQSHSFSFLESFTGSQIAVISNHEISKLYYEKVKLAIEKIKPCIEVQLISLTAGESTKSIDTFSEILDTLVRNKFKRNDLLLALGGGVVGDLTGFTAACYQRGVDFVQVPTTLLAMVDSSVGGKTAINHSKGKNLIGAFHQPAEVIIDTDCLKSLPDSEFSAGMAEVIKIAAIYDESFFEWLELNYRKICNKDASSLEYMIFRSCSLKAKVVEKDELEQGIRAILNFGHTFGHAIENLSGYGEVLHGEAVAVGMVLAAGFSNSEAKLEPSISSRLVKLLKHFNLPTKLPANLNQEQILDAMLLDKKNKDKGIRLVLIEKLGTAIIKEFSKNAIRDYLLNYKTKGEN